MSIDVFINIETILNLSLIKHEACQDLKQQKNNSLWINLKIALVIKYQKVSICFG